MNGPLNMSLGGLLDLEFPPNGQVSDVSLPDVLLRSTIQQVQPQETKVITTFQSGHTWTKSGTPGTFNLNDTTLGDYKVGTQCVSALTDGLGGNCTIQSPNTLTVDLTNGTVAIWVRVQNRKNLNKLAFQCFTTTTGNSYTWTFDHGADLFPLDQENTWFKMTLAFADATIAGSPVKSNITQARFQFSDIGATTPGATCTVYLNGVSIRPDGSNFGPRVSIVHDDGYLSGRTYAMQELAIRGMKAEFALIMDIIDNPAQPNYMSWAQVRDLHDAGHGIVFHADTLVNHNLNYYQLLQTKGAQAVDDSFVSGKRTLVEHGYADGQNTIVYPNGAFNIVPDATPSVYSIASNRFDVGRSIYSHQGQYHETMPAANQLLLRALSGITDYSGGSTNLAAVQAYLDKIKNNNGYGILVFHDIVSGTPTSTNQCSLTFYQAVLDYILASGIQVERMTDVVHTMDINQATNQQVASLSNQLARPYTWQPPDYGMAGWTYDPASALNASALGTAGLLYAERIHIPVAQNITYLWKYITTLGVLLTSGQCFSALYQNGVLLGTTADQSALWASPGTTGYQKMAIAGGPVAVTAGDVYVVSWFNGTTGPAFARSAGTTVGNLALAAAASRFGTANTGITITPPGTLGTISQYSLAYWAGVS